MAVTVRWNLYLTDEKEVEEQAVRNRQESAQCCVSASVSVSPQLLLTDLFSNPSWDECCVTMKGLKTMLHRNTKAGSGRGVWFSHIQCISCNNSVVDSDCLPVLRGDCPCPFHGFLDVLNHFLSHSLLLTLWHVPCGACRSATAGSRHQNRYATAIVHQTWTLLTCTSC